MSLSIRDLERVKDELEAQGCEAKKTKKGYMIYPPEGRRAFTFHLTPSDENQARQLARDIRRAELEIPTCLPLGKRK